MTIKWAMNLGSSPPAQRFFCRKHALLCNIKAYSQHVSLNMGVLGLGLLVVVVNMQINEE